MLHPATLQNELRDAFLHPHLVEGHMEQCMCSPTRVNVGIGRPDGGSDEVRRAIITRGLSTTSLQVD